MVNKTPLRVVFFGTSSDFTLLPLQKVALSQRLVGIVESGPRGCRENRLPALRRAGEWMAYLAGKPSLWVYAQRRKLPYFYLCRGQEEALRIFIESLHVDIGCVASFNQLLPPEIIRLPRLGMINLHPSLLPKYRGPNVWFWQYYENDRQGGVTIHHLDEGEDTGDILKQSSIPIAIGMDVNALRKNAIRLGTHLMVEALDDLSAAEARPQPQRDLPCPQRGRYLKPGEDLFHWQRWGLEHCYHFLRGLASRYKLLNRTHGFWGLFPWKATGMEMTRCESTGKILQDGRGFYFAHPQGKIRLRPDINWRKVVVIALAVVILLLVILLG